MKHRFNFGVNLIICITAVSLGVVFISLSAVTAGQTETAARVSAEKLIELPAPRLDGPMSLEKALATRRSKRSFSDRKFSIEQIGQLAWAGQGITEKTRGFRTAPSARASYPIKLYLATPSGLYLYLPEKHALQVLGEKDVRGQLSRQSSVANAGCDIILVGSVRNTSGQYGNRAEKWVLLEAGHIAQNILLQAVALDMGGVPIGGYDPNAIGKVCSLPENLEPVYLVATGFPAK